ncbi:ATP-grasp domain-containing protein, partial [Streptomyces sp. SM14]|uniref:ATP-grasp domain-containing protein n=1 Tax=Streptomyces sp. SM14 TaxID=1736045 RepID=UPI0011B05DAF
ATAWAAAHGHRLLAPPGGVTALPADKIDALTVFRASGVDVPEHVVIPAEARRPAASYWPSHWERAVLQRRENNLLGRGTWPVGDTAELEVALRRRPGRALRLSRMCPGLPLTVSGCVGGDRTVVSAVSHQLVGLPQLGAAWGTHCGDQLLAPEDVAPGLYAAARDAGRRVGETLRGLGYRGVFGLDLLADDDGDDVLAVEINPRFQTVVSLVQGAERAAGLLPSLGLHILACLLPRLPAGRTTMGPVPRLSQLVVHADRPRFLTSAPLRGRCRIAPDGSLLSESGDAAAHGPLTALGPDEALCWPHAADGGRVSPGDELLLMQFSGRTCPLEPRPALGPLARHWVTAATRSLGGPE